MSQPTPFPELNRVLDVLVEEQRRVLGDDLVAVVLQGSFATGGFDRHSDCDFVVGVRQPLTPEQVDALQDVHARVFDRPEPWAQHLEGSYFPAEVLRSIERRDEKVWYLDHGARQMERSYHCNSTVVRRTVREHGVSLFGPPPRTLVDPIPVPRLQGEILATIEDWGSQILANPDAWANRFYQGFITLHHCRAWCDLETGTVGSKRRGAEWAKPRLDTSWHDLIDRAWDTRPDPYTTSRTPADPGDYARTLDLVRLVIDKARRFAAAEGIARDPQSG